VDSKVRRTMERERERTSKRKTTLAANRQNMMRKNKVIMLIMLKTTGTMGLARWSKRARVRTRMRTRTRTSMMVIRPRGDGDVKRRLTMRPQVTHNSFSGSGIVKMCEESIVKPKAVHTVALALHALTRLL
jgi:hypothetical protein